MPGTLKKNRAVVTFDPDDPDADDFMKELELAFPNRVAPGPPGSVSVRLDPVQPDTDAGLIWQIAENENLPVLIGYPRLLQ